MLHERIQVRFPSQVVAGVILIMLCGSIVKAVDNPISYDTAINDSDVIKYNGEYYLSGNWLSGDMLSSSNLMDWGNRTHVFSYNNSWHTPSDPGNPDIDIHASHLRYDNGTFYLYAQLGTEITMATSTDITGPYTEYYPTNFASNIDADTFVDEDGSKYFYATRFNNGNRIEARPMSDLKTFSGSYQQQISASGGWEGSTNINEGSKVFKHRNRYYMLYNAYATTDPNYSIGVVEASSPLGFNNSGKYASPVLTRTTPAGGGGEINTIGQAWVVDGLNGFEKWMGYFAVTPSEGRTQRIDRMHFFDKKLYVDGPTNRYTQGYHPGPAKPQLRSLFNIPDGPMPAEDWTNITGTGTWEVLGDEAYQSSQSAFAFNAVNRNASTNYLIEANVRMAAAQDSEDKAGVLAYYEDNDNWAIVGLDRSLGYGADNWYFHVKEAGVDSIYAGGYGGSLDYSAYHKIRVNKNGSSFDLRIDDMIPPGFSTISTGFTGEGTPGLYSDHAAAVYDGVTYTIGWDEYDSNVQGWGASGMGDLPVGSWTTGSDGITQNTESGINFIFKGDAMAEYEFSAQVTKVGSANGTMGIAPVSIDFSNYLTAEIDILTDQLIINGLNGGVPISVAPVSVPDQDSYNLRAVKLSDKIIVFVDGQEMLTVNETYGLSQVGLINSNMAANYNGILAYQFEPQSLPSGWQSTDIGNVGFGGNADYNEGTFVVNGSGTDMWDIYDENHFAYQDVDGDGEIIARIVSLDETGFWAKGGIMMRDSLDEGANRVQLNITHENNWISLIWGNSAGDGTFAFDVTGMDLPVWLKLKRSGDLFEAFYSTDGSNYVLMTSIISDFTGDMQAGLFASAQNNTRIAGAVFDNVTISSFSSGILGDFNNDGIVDAADYTVWRDNLGDINGLLNDNQLGTVGQSHYDLWKTNYGATSSSANAVPEPSTTVLLFIGFIARLLPLRSRKISLWCEPQGRVSVDGSFNLALTDEKIAMAR